MFTLAAQRWIAWHDENWFPEMLERPKGEWTSIDKHMAGIRPQMIDIIEKLSDPNVQFGDVGIALQVMHGSGSLLSYIPTFEDEPIGGGSRNIPGIYEVLNSISNGEYISEKAEKQQNHNDINALYPPEEHSEEWLRAAKNKYY